MIVNEYDEKEFFDKSIKMLEKDYGNSFANDFKDIYIKQQKEIERLNKELQDTKEHLGEYLHEQEEENKRLNNIINELEKDINKRIERYDVDETINGIVIGTLKYVLNKLQELKGSDKDN